MTFVTHQRIRQRQRGVFNVSGSPPVIPWYQDPAVQLDGNNPSMISQFQNDRYAANGSAVALTDIFTVTRATTKMGIGSNGLLQSFAINTPAIVYDPVTLSRRGLLYERAATNLAIQSNNFTTSWVASATTAVPASAISPDGSNNAWALTDDGTNATHSIAISGTVTAVRHALSVYGKKGTQNVIQILGGSTTFGGNVWANFDLSTGLVGSVGSAAQAYMEDNGNGFYRCVVLGMAGSATNVAMAVNNCNNNTAMARNGTYLGTGLTTFIYGAQIEAAPGNIATSYIPTTTATVTRARDTVINSALNTVTFASYFNLLEGTIYTADVALADPVLGAQFGRAISANDAGSSNRIDIAESGASSGVLQGVITTGGVAQMTVNGATVAKNDLYKAAIAYKLDDSQFVSNGVAQATDVLVTLPVVTQLSLGDTGAMDRINYCILSEVRVYNIRGTQAGMVGITT